MATLTKNLRTLSRIQQARDHSEAPEYWEEDDNTEEKEEPMTMMNTTGFEDTTIEHARALGLDSLIEIIGRLDREVTRLDKERDALAAMVDQAIKGDA